MIELLLNGGKATENGISNGKNKGDNLQVKDCRFEVFSGFDTYSGNQRARYLYFILYKAPAESTKGHELANAMKMATMCYWL